MKKLLLLLSFIGVVNISHSQEQFYEIEKIGLEISLNNGMFLNDKCYMTVLIMDLSFKNKDIINDTIIVKLGYKFHQRNFKTDSLFEYSDKLKHSYFLWDYKKQSFEECLNQKINNDFLNKLGIKNSETKLIEK